MREARDVAAILALTLLALFVFSTDAEARVWHHTEASYYTLYGNRTACGDTMSRHSWHVAELGGSVGDCRKRVTICKRTRCVRVIIRDVGRYHEGRKWDLTPRVKHALRCSDLCSVRWRRGWV